MVRHSPRNQRNKGFKVKHALQICLLLAVSIWLLYQIHHSRNKKVAIGESTKISEGVQNGNDIIKLGRKDLQPQVEGSIIEDVRHKEDQEEEESKPEEHENDQEKVGEEGEHKGDFIDEERETETKEEEIDESKNTYVKEEEREENREKEREEEAEDGKDKENEQEGNDCKKEEVERKEDEREESNEEQRGEESKDNGSEETQEKSYEENDTTENGESEDNQTKETKEEEGENTGSEEKEFKAEEMINSKENEERKTDEKTREVSEEKEHTIEDSGSSENQVQDGNDGEAAKEENQEGENVSSEVVLDSQNILETERAITEKSNGEEQIENNEGKESEEKGTKNTEATNVNQNDSGSNVTENETIAKNDSAILIASEGNKNGTNLLVTGDSSNHTTGTMESNEQLQVNDNSTSYAGETPTSDPTADSTQNKNKMVDNTVLYGDSTQTILKEQTEKTEEMAGGENSDLNSAPATTENKDSVNGESTESFNKIEYVALDGQSAYPSTSIETLNRSENSTGNEDNDTVQNQKSDTGSETAGAEHGELSNENVNADSGQNNSGDSSTSESQADKEASSSPNDNADAIQHDDVDSSTFLISQDEKDARTDLATLPDSGTEWKGHETAAEK